MYVFPSNKPHLVKDPRKKKTLQLAAACQESKTDFNFFSSFLGGLQEGLSGLCGWKAVGAGKRLFLKVFQFSNWMSFCVTTKW